MNDFDSNNNHDFILDQINTVIIEDDITNIGNYAFYNCELDSIEFNNTITLIGDYAFYRSYLFNITLPQSLTSIGSSAFYYNNLTEVTIPKSVTSIGSSAFYYNQLTKITMNTDISFSNGLVYRTPYYHFLFRDSYNKGKSGVYTGTQNGNWVRIGDVPIKYIVKFQDYDGTVINIQNIEKGDDAISPEIPTRFDYTFTAWNVDYTNIQSNEIIIAQYRSNQEDKKFKIEIPKKIKFIAQENITINKYLLPILKSIQSEQNNTTTTTEMFRRMTTKGDVFFRDKKLNKENIYNWE